MTIPRPSDEWNGKWNKEIPGAHEDEEVYCVTCGTTYVFANDRTCPSCTLAAAMEKAGIAPWKDD